MEESEELPRILGAIAEDASAAVLGGASALDQAPVDRDLLMTAIEAASPALARLRVGTALCSVWERPVCIVVVGTNDRDLRSHLTMLEGHRLCLPARWC